MKKIFYGWWVVLAGFTIALYVSAVVFYGFTAFFEPLIEEFGWSHTQVSFAASLRGLEMGFFAPLVGFLVHRLGSRKLIFAGAIFVGLGLILLSFTRSLSMFYASFLLLGLGAGGCTSVVTMAAVANWFERNVGKAFGLLASGFGASGLFIPLIVWLIASYGWRTTLLILGVGMWVLGIPMSFIIRDKPEKYGYRIDGEEAGKRQPVVKLPTSRTNLTFREAIHNRNFLYLNINEFIQNDDRHCRDYPYHALSRQFGYVQGLRGIHHCSRSLWSIVGRLGFGWLSDAFEKKYVMIGAFGLMAAGMLAFSYGQITWLVFSYSSFFFRRPWGGRWSCGERFCGNILGGIPLAECWGL